MYILYAYLTYGCPLYRFFHKKDTYVHVKMFVFYVLRDVRLKRFYCYKKGNFGKNDKINLILTFHTFTIRYQLTVSNFLASLMHVISKGIYLLSGTIKGKYH